MKKYLIIISVGFFALLAILFIALKFLGIIEWHWCLVFSPIWGPATLLVSIAPIVLILLNVRDMRV